MTIDPLQYKPKGDKKNSEFFETYKVKIYERRKSGGLDDMLETIRALVVQVEHGDALPYLRELHLMGPYRFHKAFQSPTHRIFILMSQHLLSPILSERGLPDLRASSEPVDPHLE